MTGTSALIPRPPRRARARPAQPLDLRRGGCRPPRRRRAPAQRARCSASVDVRLAPRRAAARASRPDPSPAGTCAATREPLVHRLRGAAPRACPRTRRCGPRAARSASQRVERGVREAGHRVVPDRRRELRVAPWPRATPPTLRRGGVAGRRRREAACRRRGAAPPSPPARRSTACPCWSAAQRQEGRDVADRAGVAQEPRRRARASAAGARPRGGRGRSWAGSYPVGAAQAPDAGERGPGDDAGVARRSGPPPRRRPDRDRDRAQQRRPRRSRARPRSPPVAASPERRGPASRHAAARLGPVVRDDQPVAAARSPRTRPGRSGRPAPRSRGAGRASPAPGARTGCPRPPRRPRPAAAPHRRTPAWSRSRCRGGRP